MHIKRMHTMIEDLTAYAECAVESGVGNGSVNLCDIGQIIDMIKDLASAEYHARLAKCLEKDEEEEKEADKYILMLFKSQYGDDEGKRYYDDWRYRRTGEFAPKGRGAYTPRRGYEEPPYYHMTPEEFKEHDAEWYRDMDRKSRNVLYYTEPMKDDKRMEESKLERARRAYTETKMTEDNTAEGKKKAMESLDKYTKEIAEDITQLISNMDNSEKTMLKSRLQTLLQKLS